MDAGDKTGLAINEGMVSQLNEYLMTYSPYYRKRHERLAL
jgi:hypothetical protein